MPTILETTNFNIKAHDKPHHSRENGGHIVITPKEKFAHRYEMPLNLASDLTHLTSITGEAATTVLTKKGINIVRINYQDNGNWAYMQPPKPAQLHVHLYIRTWGEKHPTNDTRFQAFPNALTFPDPNTSYYDDFQPLTTEDCQDIKNEILVLLESKKYQSLKALFVAN